MKNGRSSRTFQSKNENKESEKYRSLKKQIKTMESEIRALQSENKQLRRAFEKTVERLNSVLENFSLEEIIGLDEE